MSLFAIAVVAVILVNGSYSQPFATPLGQLGLLVLGVLFVASLRWLRRMAVMEEEPRTLLTAEERAKEKESEPDLVSSVPGMVLGSLTALGGTLAVRSLLPKRIPLDQVLRRHPRPGATRRVHPRRRRRGPWGGRAGSGPG